MSAAREYNKADKELLTTPAVFPMTQGPWRLRSRVWIIALIYALFATLWIYFSDQALFALAPDPQTFSRWSVYKGIAFVAFTSILLLLLIWRAFGALEIAYGALRELNKNLNAKVAERTQALEAAVFRAEAADRLKSAFLATMSHELRTPLNSIIGFTGIMAQGLAGPLTPEQEKQLAMVRGSARHLLDLINDILDLSKIEAGQLQVKPAEFDLRQSLQQVVDSVMPLAAKKDLVLLVELDQELAVMCSDRRRVEQILLNLLNNAIKFTDTGSVALYADVLAQPSDNSSLVAPLLRLRVRDTGIGIRQQDQVALFEPFSQVDTGLSRQHEGTGLGLAICRKLALLLGGSIEVRSEWGEGSEFTVLLPMTLPGSNQTAEKTAVEGMTGGSRLG